ncbi:MAG: hypothetical protein Q4E10_00935 [Porphyromonas sp.]|nr:hypothetical protein [Porphyromonas sp.]
MNRYTKLLTLTLFLVSLTLSLPATAVIAGDGLTDTPSNSQPSVDPIDLGTTDQEDQAAKTRREQYLQDRLNAISKAAQLTEAEQAVVTVELEKYDQVRFKTWREARKIYEEIAKAGSKATDEQYKEGLERLNTINAERDKANSDFINALQQKLSPKKAYLTYEACHRFNVQTSRRLRHSRNN